MKDKQDAPIITLKQLMRSRAFASFTMAAVLLGLCGCGYSHKPLYTNDIHTVAVPIFGNRTFYQGIERDVTEAVINEIELQTPYKVVPRDQADSLLAGAITSVNQHRLGRGQDGGLPQEMEMSVRINFKWQDLKTGHTLAQRSGFDAVGRYIPASPTGETFHTAQHAASQRLANGIVAIMRSPW